MEKIADLLTKFMISESSSENLDYEVCKFGLLMAIEVAINTVIALCISFLLGMFRYGILFLTFFSLLRAFAGGVHLERFWSCTVLSGMVLSMVLLIAKYAVIQASFSGQMLWSFHFATIFSQADTNIFFRIIASERFHISEVFLLRCTEG